VGIDTGNLTKYLRNKQIQPSQEKQADFIVNHFSSVLSGVKIGLRVANWTHRILGTRNMETLTQGLRKISKNTIPLWTKSLPKPITINKNSVKLIASSKKVVYFTSCLNRTMGQAQNSTEQDNLFDVTLELLTRAGFEVIFPNNLENLCCGMPFSSKGYFNQANKKSQELEMALLEASNHGEFPVLCDTSPCTKKMMESFKSQMAVYEPIEFSLNYLLPSLTITKLDEPIVIHTTCSSRKMGLHDKFITLAKACANEVIVPADVKCCGFAGDRGFNFPELNASALSSLKQSIPNGVKLAFSTSKTCEIGLSEQSGVDYNSIFYLLKKVSQ
jgi:D-lactate dehydrogenase